MTPDLYHPYYRVFGLEVSLFLKNVTPTPGRLL